MDVNLLRKKKLIEQRLTYTTSVLTLCFPSLANIGALTLLANQIAENVSLITDVILLTRRLPLITLS